MEVSITSTRLWEAEAAARLRRIIRDCIIVITVVQILPLLSKTNLDIMGGAVRDSIPLCMPGTVQFHVRELERKKCRKLDDPRLRR
jgi:hypothetical protein